jgi:RHS repeat-associated protein
VRKAAAGGTPVEYLWDGDTVLGQRADEEVEYLYRPGTFLPLVQFDRGGPLLLALDPVGLPVAALAHDGQTAWEAEIDPHAGVAAERGEPGRVALRYPGQMADAETGLVYNRMRYLDPETRQYVSPDPIGLSGGFHPFNYTVDPLAQIDPYGLNPCGTLPPGAKVVRDGSPKYIVYEVNGEKRIRFKADEAVTLKEANPGRNYTTDTYAGLDPAGQPYVHEGRHRAIGASQGATVPEELGGVPSAPGYLDYEFSNNVAPSGGKPVKDLSIDNSVPDLDKAAADQAHQNKIRRK